MGLGSYRIEKQTVRAPKPRSGHRNTGVETLKPLLRHG